MQSGNGQAGEGSRDWRKRGKNHRIPSKPHRNPIEAPSKPLRNITLTSRLHHAYITPAARSQQARRWLSVLEPEPNLSDESVLFVDNLSHCASLPRFIES